MLACWVAVVFTFNVGGANGPGWINRNTAVSLSPSREGGTIVNYLGGGSAFVAETPAQIAQQGCRNPN